MRILLWIGLCVFPLVVVGCGGSGPTGVATAPDEPVPELSPEEKKAEAESARSAAGR